MRILQTKGSGSIRLDRIEFKIRVQCRKETTEKLIGPLNKGLHRAEVRIQTKDFTLCFCPLQGPEVDLQIRPAKPVDGLFRISNQAAMVLFSSKEGGKNFPLSWGSRPRLIICRRFAA